MIKKTFAAQKHLFAAAAFAAFAISALPAVAGTIVNGTSFTFAESATIISVSTRPDGFYVRLSKAADPGGLVLQGTTTAASCSNTIFAVPKDNFYDSKIYRDTVSLLQLASATGKTVTVYTAHCFKNFDVTAAQPTNAYNYPIVYGLDIAN
jgi:hypothetical protein